MIDLLMAVMASKIGGSGGGSSPILVEKSVTSNGIYNASDDSCDGFSKVTVNVPSPPAPVLISKNIGANGTYAASGDNADGYSSVTVEVPAPEPPVLISKSVTANGTYTAASDSADGYSSVTVAVPAEPMKLCIIDSSYDWSDYSQSGFATAHLMRQEDKSSSSRATQRAAACGSIYIPAGKTAVIYTDVEGMEVAGWRTTEVGYPYNGELNWGRDWVSTPATIDNSNSAVPYVFVPHFRYSDDRTLTDENRPQFCFAEIT